MSAASRSPRTRLVLVFLVPFFGCATPNGHAGASPGTAAGPPTAGEKLAAEESGLAPLAYDPALDRFLGCAAAGKTIDCLPKPATVRRGGEIDLLRALDAAAPDQKAALLVQSVQVVGGPITPAQPACARQVVAKVRLLARRGRCVLVKDHEKTDTIRVPALAGEGVVAMAKQKLTGIYQSEIVSLVDASPPAQATMASKRILCDTGAGRLTLDVDAYDGAYAYATVHTHYAGDGPDGKPTYRCEGTQGIDLSTPKTLPQPAQLDESAKVRLLASLSPYRVLGGRRAAELFACAAKGASPSCLSFEDDYYESWMPTFEGIPTDKLRPLVDAAFGGRPLGGKACTRPAWVIAAKAVVAGRCVVARKAALVHHFHLDQATRARLVTLVPTSMRRYVGKAPASMAFVGYDVLCKAGGATVQGALFATGDAGERRYIGLAFEKASLPGGKQVCASQ